MHAFDTFANTAQPRRPEWALTTVRRHKLLGKTRSPAQSATIIITTQCRIVAVAGKRDICRQGFATVTRHFTRFEWHASS